MMQKNIIISAIAIAMLTSCGNNSKNLASIEAGNIKVEHIEKSDGAELVREILARRAAVIDSIKAPVIGRAAKELTSYTPESPLMNFAADALLFMARQKSGEQIDIAITNKGGLRNIIAQGDITFGDIYNVFPFENTLALVTLDGEQLLQLFADIAAVGGEAISGARLTITADGKLTSATVGGKKIIPSKKYRIATSDYLSQGNDKLYTFEKSSNVTIKSDITIRDLMIDYIKMCHSNGKTIDASTDGRITIK